MRILGTTHRARRARVALVGAAVAGLAACHPGLPVAGNSLPAPVPGSSQDDIGYTGGRGDHVDGVGALRVNCSMSHMAWDDPIVAPGQPGASHLHVFFGNTAVNANSTPSSMADTGNSTCTGGTANRTGYWTPAMIDTATDRPVTAFHGINSNWQHVASPAGEHGLQVYYKTGYRGVRSNQVVNFPAGLRMIAGSAARTSADGRPWYDQPVLYRCQSPNDHGAGAGHSQSIPNCAAGQLLIMSILFPQCWDGVNLDSPNHQSHMAYANNGCPASHPVPLTEVTMNVRYLVPPGGTANWRLSSDTYSGAAGYSGHADWYNGWDRSVFQRVITNCFGAGLDCHMNLLGDGYELR